jgi:hypothetical protein
MTCPWPGCREPVWLVIEERGLQVRLCRRHAERVVREMKRCG